MAWRRLGCLVVLASGLALAPGGWPASLWRESFYDELHGWRTNGGRLEETNNGGRSWRTITGEGYDIAGVLRTGLKAGLYLSGSTEVFWTNGGQFFKSRRITVPAAGFGQFLFWWRGPTLYRVTPWPFPERCVEATASEECVYEDARGRSRVARFAASVVITVPEGKIGDAVTIPGGVVVVNRAARTTDRPYAATTRWLNNGPTPRVVTQFLPGSSSTPLTTCEQTLSVDWPGLVVAACSLIPSNPPIEGPIAGLWRSFDGGRSWTLHVAVPPREAAAR